MWQFVKYPNKYWTHCELQGVDEGYICQTVIHELKLAVALTTSEAPYDAGYSGLEDEGLRGFKGN